MFAAGHQGHTVGHWALCLRAKCKKRKYNYTLNKKKLSYGQQNTVQVKQVVPPSQCLQPHCWCLHEWQQRHGALSNTSNFKKAGYSELSLVRNCSLTLRHREQTLLSTGEKTSTYRQQAEERPAYPVFIQKFEVTYWILVFQSDEFLDDFSSCYTADHDRWTHWCWVVEAGSSVLTGETLGGSFDMKQQESSLTLIEATLFIRQAEQTPAEWVNRSTCFWFFILFFNSCAVSFWTGA